MDEVIAQLSEYGACDAADALFRLKHLHGGFLSGLTLRAPDSSARIVGRAHTVLFRLHSDGPQEKSFKGHYIDTIKPGTVLVISCPPIPNAVFGGLMSLRASLLGCAGAVVDGRIRDLAEHREVGLPVFSRDVGITAGQELAYPAEINVPVPLHSLDQPGVIVRPGDIIIGDENGVCCIPSEMAERVVEMLPKLVEQDRRVREALRDGKRAEEAFKLRSL